MANPPGIHHQDASPLNGAHYPAGGSNGCAAPESSGAALKHNPGISCEWSADEQAILEDGLAKYASESSINRYAKIAIQLHNKTVRDVALRCRWMSKKENSKRRKEENRKNKDRKERVSDSSGTPFPFASQPNASSSSYPNTANYEDGISYNAIGGVTGKLLEQNAHAFSQISANFSTMQIHDNLDLLRQTRDNILHLTNSLNDGPEIMRQMPPLPVRLSEELASTIMPPPNLPRSAY